MSDQVTQLYNTLFAGKRVTLLIGDRKAYNSLRVALAKKHQHAKLLLELTDASLCADFDEATGSATFFLGEARRARTRATFTIIAEEEPNAEV